LDVVADEGLDYHAWERGGQLRVALAESLPNVFVQAEDGIRDYKVTGVQTCALPISIDALGRAMRDSDPHEVELVWNAAIALAQRSEERRVGKEFRARARQGDLQRNHPRRGRRPAARPEVLRRRRVAWQ